MATTTTITITIPGSLTETGQHDLRLLLQDAFHEFATKRSPAEGYVADRYAGIMGPDEAKVKIGQVARRVMYAKALFSAAFDAKIEVSK